VKLVSAPGINKLEIRENDQVVESIEKDDIESFLGLETGILDPDLIEQKDRIASLEIVRLSFKGENKWTLTDGTTPFNVDIVDEAFLEKVNRGEIFFKKGDVLRVKFITRTRRTKDGLKSEYIVSEVFEVSVCLRANTVAKLQMTGRPHG
jgi:hypothetical protein